MDKTTSQSWFLFMIIAIGLVLRLVWTSDMEWKDDEQWMYNKAHEVAATHRFPAAGMRSGGGIVNPGISVAAFAVVASFTDSPLSMNRVVQWMNVLAVIGFLFFVLKKINYKEREIWLLGIALAAVSPLAVLFSRKIWAQDLLPVLSLIIIWANASRNKRSGSFIWGLGGALIGQIHMSGFFFAAGLFVFTVLHDHYNKLKFHRMFWIAGSIIGSIPIIPWISFMMNNPQVTKQSFWHIFQFNFYLCWFLDSQGLNIMYSMRKEFWQFIKEPIVSGVPTYLMALIHLFLAAAGLVTIVALVKFSKKGIRFLKEKSPAGKIFLHISQTRFYLFSILLGLGIFMTLSGTTIYTHYLICAFPFSYIFLAKILEHRKRLLHGVIIAQLMITMAFLVYVHNHNGIENGDYGKAYHTQVK
ncbi:MAG: hypothetical protein NT126_11565 [Bacteroidetes bacterium]|nr:hypothetical protein [Bacteroidota bacterium]